MENSFKSIADEEYQKDNGRRCRFFLQDTINVLKKEAFQQVYGKEF